MEENNLKHLNMPALKATFTLVGLPRGNAVLLSQGKYVLVRTLLEATSRYIERFLTATQQLKNGLFFWGVEILKGDQREHVLEQLEKGKAFLEQVLTYNRLERFKDFQYDLLDIEQQKEHIVALERVHNIVKYCHRFQPLTSWIDLAMAYTSDDHPWMGKARQTKKVILSTCEEGKLPNAADLQKVLEELKKSYIQDYLLHHQQCRLNAEEKIQRQDLLKDDRIHILSQLSSLVFFSPQPVIAIRDRLAQMMICDHLTERDLDIVPICPYCHYRILTERPISERLHFEKSNIETLFKKWTWNLCEFLKEPWLQEKRARLNQNQQHIIQEWVNSKTFEHFPALMEALNVLLEGVKLVTVSPADLERALHLTDLSVSIEKMKQGWQQYVEALTVGSSSDQVQVILEKTENS